MTNRFFAVLSAIVLACLGGIERPSPAETIPRVAEVDAKIQANDNRDAAGTRHERTVDVALDAVAGRWQPDGPGKATTIVDAFAERGHAPQIPGPLLRVTVGSDIRIRLRNTLPGKTLYVHNLVDFPSRADKPLVIATGEERIARVHAFAAGTYLYWAATTNAPIGKHVGADSMLSGAIVVDPPDAKSGDRVFVINIWNDVYTKAGDPNNAFGVYTINGRRWPQTERLAYDKGTIATWHLVNASFEAHPMHLHGFPFSVLDRGDGTNIVRPRDEREVTELLAPGATARIRFVAARPGAWMFHCHIAYHMLPANPRSFEFTGGVGPRSSSFAQGQHLPMTAGSAMHDMAMEDGAMNAAMGGLVLSVAVRDPKSAALPPQVRPVHHLTLIVDPGPAPMPKPTEPVFPQYRYSLRAVGAARAESTHPAARDNDIADIGPPIFLVRGEPTGITVVNHLDEATSVHWHGIELQDSYQDGGGLPDPWHRPAAMIMPGAAHEARFTAPRAGTFMYHTHMDDAWQLGGGLVGPLIVLEPGQRFDPSSDHVVLITSPRDTRKWDHVNVNGRIDPTPIDMVAGVEQRLRLINLTEFTTGATAVLNGPADESAPTWKLIARDGFALRAPLAVPNAVPFTVGATRDLSLGPMRPGDFTLEIHDADGGSIVAKIPVHVVARAIASTVK